MERDPTSNPTERAFERKIGARAFLPLSSKSGSAFGCCWLWWPLSCSSPTRASGRCCRLRSTRRCWGCSALRRSWRSFRSPALPGFRATKRSGASSGCPACRTDRRRPTKIPSARHRPIRRRSPSGKSIATAWRRCSRSCVPVSRSPGRTGSIRSPFARRSCWRWSA